MLVDPPIRDVLVRISFQERFLYMIRLVGVPAGVAMTVLVIVQEIGVTAWALRTGQVALYDLAF
jgi:hypothetical protein